MAVYEFIAGCPDGVLAVDRRQTIVLWNEGATRILGYRSEEVVGSACFRVLRGRDAEGCAVCRLRCDAILRAERLEGPPTRDVECHARDGRAVWLNVSSVPVPSARRELAVLVHIFREVSEEHRLRAAAEKLASIVEHRSLGGGESPAGEASPAASLTPRERQVLALLASGVPNDAIAKRLGISPRTVRNHVTNLLGKLGVHSRLEAVALTLGNRID